MQHPTGPAPTAPRPAREVRTLYTRPEQATTATTWRCIGCDTYVTTALAVCETCGYDRQGNDSYVYTDDPRPEHAVVLSWPDGDTAADAIKADTAPEALEAARANWPGAAVALVDAEEAPRC
ncbi:hypothetical protein [Nocardiopsis tropica]|uniref:Uncharacterized protein n=1 Tax=Nocardiopsis tropica TaxID=109330 RepID=A0ABU7KRB4_9ACTN|nr:hypothetical protein [Nocardiopsis umidischolae]MEE2051827.1 hypothetical protein [Nocardiopsis umidischolae]